MKNNKKFLFYGFVICVIFIITFYFHGLLKKNEIFGTATQEQIVTFNDVIASVNTQDDIKNCEKIGNTELEEICKSQLENTFSSLYKANNISICYSDNDQLKQDMCILELAYSQSKNTDDTGLCNEVKTQDIKDACFAQINNKTFSY